MIINKHGFDSPDLIVTCFKHGFVINHSFVIKHSFVRFRLARDLNKTRKIKKNSDFDENRGINSVSKLEI